MGSSFGIICRLCDFTKDFRIGIGMQYNSYNLRDFESEFALLPYLLIRSKVVTEDDDDVSFKVDALA
ncbi:MAG: hypothetical protein KGZ96_05055 [Clostridia bacterium]|jgi:hypothetical protein|nr:hypothetical protein [Clostridia bacterium]